LNNKQSYDNSQTASTLTNILSTEDETYVLALCPLLCASAVFVLLDIGDTMMLQLLSINIYLYLPLCYLHPLSPLALAA